MSSGAPVEATVRIRTGARAGGQPPFGWELVPAAALVEVPAEQNVIWLIGHLAGRGWSSRKIAQALTDLQLPSPSGGEVWLHPAVLAVMSRNGIAARPANGLRAAPTGEQIERAASG